MDIINNEITAQLRSDLLLSLQENEKIIGDKIEQSLSQIRHWKFATDEYFSPIPYYNELNKLKKGRLLKNISEAERFSKRNQFSFGFDEADRLLLVQSMIGDEIKFGVNTKLYEYGDENDTIAYFAARYYPGKDFPDKLISTGLFKKLDDTIKIDIVTGSGSSWSVTYYLYDPGASRIRKAIRYALGWNGQTEFDFVYENDELTRIMVAEIVWWKRQ